MPLEHWAECFWSSACKVTRQLVTGSHMSDVGIAVDWSQGSKVQSKSETEDFLQAFGGGKE